MQQVGRCSHRNRAVSTPVCRHIRVRVYACTRSIESRRGTRRGAGSRPGCHCTLSWWVAGYSLKTPPACHRSPGLSIGIEKPARFATRRVSLRAALGSVAQGSGPRLGLTGFSLVELFQGRVTGVCDGGGKRGGRRTSAGKIPAPALPGVELQDTCRNSHAGERLHYTRRRGVFPARREDYWRIPARKSSSHHRAGG